MGNGEPIGRRLPPELQDFASEHLGPITATEDLSWDHGESQVWLVVADRQRAVLKAHRQGRKFANEHAAYLDWAPRLRPNLGEGTVLPELLAVRREHPRALLLGWVEGRPASGLNLAPGEERSLHERAGAFLRELHRLEVEDDDPLPLARAFEARLKSWSERVSGLLNERTIAAVVGEASAALPFIAGAVRVPCHRDFTPRNWLVGSAGVPDTAPLTVIDFEHSMPDLYLTDLQRLWAGTWRLRPDLREAFLTGYGRDLSDEEETALRRISALWALSTVGWAREHADAEFERLGRDTLEWLGLAG